MDGRRELISNNTYRVIVVVLPIERIIMVSLNRCNGRVVYARNRSIGFGCGSRQSNGVTPTTMISAAPDAVPECHS